MLNPPFSDSVVTFKTNSGKTIGPLRIAIFNPDNNPVVVIEDKKRIAKMFLFDTATDIANFVCNNLYRGAFKEPSKIVWLESGKYIERISMDNDYNLDKNKRYPEEKILFFNPMWSLEKNKDMIALAKGLKPLEKRGSVPPYEPGYR